MRKIENLDQLKLYLKTVLRNARHHAHNVEKIIPVIAGEVLTHGTEFYARVGRTSEFGNIAQFLVNGTSYSLKFNHGVGRRDQGWIELRRGNFNGEPICRFTNETPVKEITEIFAAL